MTKQDYIDLFNMMHPGFFHAEIEFYMEVYDYE